MQANTHPVLRRRLFVSTTTPLPGMPMALPATAQALASGEVSAPSTVVADTRSLVIDGKARLLTIDGERRDPTFPAVPDRDSGCLL